MKPYSYDLRIRIFNYSLSHSIRETAKVFHVSPNTVHLLQKLFYETGSLEPHAYPNEKPHLITDEGEMYLKMLLIHECDGSSRLRGVTTTYSIRHNQINGGLRHQARYAGITAPNHIFRNNAA